MTGEVELVVVEHLLTAEEHEHDPEPLSRLRERNGEHRRAVGLLRHTRQRVVEAAVVAETARRQHLARPGGGDQGRRLGAEVRGEARREVVRTRELELAAGGTQHGGGVAAQRLRRRLGDRIQRRLSRQRLAEHRGDPVERPLDLCLSSALLVDLCVAQCDRGEARERLDQPQVGFLEAPRLVRPDAEHAADLAEREDRRVHHLGEDGVAGVRRWLLG